MDSNPQISPPHIDEKFHSSPTSWSPIRCELLNWFRQNAESLANAYEGAARLVQDPTFPGRVHFIAHVVRDISDRLVFALDRQLDGNRVQYANELDCIAKDWPSLNLLRNDAPQSEQPGALTIEYALAVRIDKLVKAHCDSRERPSNHELLFDYLTRNEPASAEVNQRLVSDFKKVHRWFMERAHLRRTEEPPVDETELQSQFSKFERMLHSFVGSFFTGTAEIDEILQQANQ